MRVKAYDSRLRTPDSRRINTVNAVHTPVKSKSEKNLLLTPLLTHPCPLLIEGKGEGEVVNAVQKMRLPRFARNDEKMGGHKTCPYIRWMDSE